MSTRESLLHHVPAPLLDDLVQGRWLPIIGAGFSKNATLTQGPAPPDWRQLGERLSEDVPDLVFDNTLDTISAYEHAFGRVALIGKVADLLRARHASPGAAHLAFAKCSFDRVITTNFDMLLERAYEMVNRPCLPLLEEFQLSGSNPYTGPTLLKLHGDIHHPQRMVLTEDDYDGFLRRHPLLATHVASYLIDHTALLVGYSLDDPDMRQLLTLLRDRLGALMRPLWTVVVGAPAHVVTRFERRGVHVINLPLPPGRTYGDVLSEFFDAVSEYWRKHLIAGMESPEGRALAELRLPKESSKTCFFAVPYDALWWYRSNVYPIVVDAGLVPLDAYEVATPGDSISAKLDALISQSQVVVAEAGNRNTDFEARLAVTKLGSDRVIVVAAGSLSVDLLSELPDSVQLLRPLDSSDSGDFLDIFSERIRSITARLDLRSMNEPERLLVAGEFRAALIASMSEFERELASVDALLPYARRRQGAPPPLRELIAGAVSVGFLTSERAIALNETARLRNEALHRGRAITPREAQDAVGLVKSAIHEIHERGAEPHRDGDQ